MILESVCESMKYKELLDFCCIESATLHKRVSAEKALGASEAPPERTRIDTNALDDDVDDGT